MDEFDLQMIKNAVNAFVKERVDKYVRGEIHGGDLLASVGPVLQAFDKLSIFVKK